MGNWWSSIKKLFETKNSRWLMLGIDNAGKTSCLNKLKFGEVSNTIPTIGFNVETLEHKGMSITVWDVGGQHKIRTLWRHYFQNNQGLVFVIDSTETPDRMEEAKEALFDILRHNELDGVPLLVFANKQDMKESRSVSQVIELLSLQSVRNREWFCQACSCLTGDGLFAGFDWLASHQLENK
jgi:ADP-ribosylation factor protein 1